MNHGNNFFHRRVFPREQKRHVKKKETPKRIYHQSLKNYSLKDLLSYEPGFKPEDIKGPKHERPIIKELLLMNLQLIKPLEDLLCTSTPQEFSYEVDLLQRALIIPKGVISDLRFEVKKGFRSINEIREQLTNIPGELIPVIVEYVREVAPESITERLEYLSEELSDIAIGFIIHDGSSFNVKFNLELIENPLVINEILDYQGFDNPLERDLLITAYSLFNNLGYLGRGFKNLLFEDGLLIGDDCSFSTQPIGRKDNHLIIFEPPASTFRYHSLISELLRDDFSGGLDEQYTTMITYEPPLARADSVISLKPNTSSNSMLTHLLIKRKYLLKMLNGLQGLIRVDYDF